MRCISCRSVGRQRSRGTPPIGCPTPR
jgi:hypothetical protein